MPTAHEIDCSMGKIIRYHRRAAALTQSDLGNASGVRFQQVQKYETGANRISISRLFAIADALNVSPTTLVELVQEDLGQKHHLAEREQLQCLEFLSDQEPRKLLLEIINLEDTSVRDALIKLVCELSNR